MNIHELTAGYICENEERMEMALHVYEARKQVQDLLVGSVLKRVGDELGVEPDYKKGGVYYDDDESVVGELLVGARVRYERRKGYFIVGIGHKRMSMEFDRRTTTQRDS